MWQCKECGGIKFKAHLHSSIPNGIILKNKNFVVDKNDIIGFECKTCNCYHENIEELAVWKEEKMKKQYAYSFDNLNFGISVFESKEEALADVRKSANIDNKVVYIGEVEFYKETCSGLASDVVELLQQKAYNELEDLANDYMELTKEEEKIFEEMLKETILKFQEKFNHEPNFFTVYGVEKIIL
mgnify:FL=1